MSADDPWSGIVHATDGAAGGPDSLCVQASRAPTTIPMIAITTAKGRLSLDSCIAANIATALPNRQYRKEPIVGAYVDVFGDSILVVYDSLTLGVPVAGMVGTI